MSRSQTERLATRLRSSSPPKKRIPVSFATEYNILGEKPHTYTHLDVIVLTAMGEQLAIEAKEAPRN